MRSILYWLISITIAAFAAITASADSVPAPDGGTPISAAITVPSLPLPEIARAILLFVGVLAVAYCYQQAWSNFSKDAS